MGHKVDMKTKWRVLAFSGLTALIVGCSHIGYYVQAAHGQFSLLAEAKPIEDWLSDPEVSGTLKDKLTKVQEIRRFAARELALPDNESYKSYADLKRPYVLWNVVATEEFSLKPMKWCFPVAGCVNYRGYYSKEDATAYAAELRAQRYDVQVGGVPAYSTLGFFNDPVLSTFIKYPEGELARLVFHELAHQVVYAQGDTKFNEAFAVAVEEVGVERWLATYGDEKMRNSYRDYQRRKEDFLALLTKCRDELEENYERDVDDQEKRRRKAEIFESLKERYQVLKAQWGGYSGYDRWFAEPLSNAHLSAISTYHDLVPGFRALLAREKRLDQFYAAVRKLSTLDKEQRHEQLAGLARAHQMATESVEARLSR